MQITDSKGDSSDIGLLYIWRWLCCRPRNQSLMGVGRRVWVHIPKRVSRILPPWSEMPSCSNKLIWLHDHLRIALLKTVSTGLSGPPSSCKDTSLILLGYTRGGPSSYLGSVTCWHVGPSSKAPQRCKQGGHRRAMPQRVLKLLSPCTST